MREFFRGWRRKTGVLTLLMACLVVSVWMRGFTVEDVFRLGNGQGMTTRGKVLHTLSMSARNGFVWTREEAAHQSFTWRAGWQSHPTDNSISFDPLECPIDCRVMDWRWQLWGFDFGQYHAANNDRLVFWRISPLSIIIPPALISLWLLLSKPKKSSRMKN